VRIVANSHSALIFPLISRLGGFREVGADNALPLHEDFQNVHLLVSTIEGATENVSKRFIPPPPFFSNQKILPIFAFTESYNAF